MNPAPRTGTVIFRAVGHAIASSAVGPVSISNFDLADLFLNPDRHRTAAHFRFHCSNTSLHEPRLRICCDHAILQNIVEIHAYFVAGIYQSCLIDEAWIEHLGGNSTGEVLLYRSASLE